MAAFAAAEMLRKSPAAIDFAKRKPLLESPDPLKHTWSKPYKG
jgi:hypothetical protein